MPVNQGAHGQVKGMNPYTILGYLEFSPNGASDPSSTYTKGSLLGNVNTLVYTSTGLYTLTFKKGTMLGPRVRFIVTQVINGTTYFLAMQRGQVVVTAGVPVLLIVTLDGTFALLEVAASTGDARVQITMVSEESTGV